MRNVWCIGIRPKDLDGKAPAAYVKAEDGQDRAPGLYGGGFRGEALVCLFPKDDGAWFRKVACEAPRHGCRHEPKGS